MPDELDRDHPTMAKPPGGGETPPPLEGHSPGRGPEHGLRGGAGGNAPAARDTRPDRATRFIETTRGVLYYAQIAPLLAEQVLLLEAAIHPFQDFNGRTIRLFLLELLRRLDLPLVVLAPALESERQTYFRALEAADRSQWQPLVEIWQHRFTTSTPNPSAES